MDIHLLTQVIDMVLAESNSEEIGKIILSLPQGNEEALSKFCYLYELGNWFYEALILNDIDIFAELEHLMEERVNEEALVQIDLRELLTH